jgi:hypothetical protein
MKLFDLLVRINGGSYQRVLPAVLGRFLPPIR